LPQNCSTRIADYPATASPLGRKSAISGKTLDPSHL
jgi:hypothetical protein